MKAKVSASQTKQMGLASMHNKRLVYTNYMRRETIANADFILSSPEEVPEGSLPEKPDRCLGSRCSTQRMLLFPLPRKVQAFLAKKSICLAPHPLYSP